MFRCERCGTGFNATVAHIAETCPRCRSRGIDARLTFRLFEPPSENGSKDRGGDLLSEDQAEHRGRKR